MGDTEVLVIASCPLEGPTPIRCPQEGDGGNRAPCHGVSGNIAPDENARCLCEVVDTRSGEAEVEFAIWR